MNHCDYCQQHGPKNVFPLAGLPWLPTEQREVKALPDGTRRCLGCVSQLLESDKPLRHALAEQRKGADLRRSQRANPETFAECGNLGKCSFNADSQASDQHKHNSPDGPEGATHTSVPTTINSPVERVPCARCSRPFDRVKRRGRPQIYCGQDCAKAAANRQRQGKAVR